MQNKPHLALDGYKTGHKDQYPVGTEFVYSNLTARSASHFNKSFLWDDKAVFIGLQGFVLEFLIEAWNEGFFKRPKDVVVAEYKRRMDTYLGPDAVNVQHIADLHDLGYMPILIRAVPEGSRVNTKVPFLTIVNTLPQFFWLTNYLETILSAELWQVINNATTAYEYRRVLDYYVELTGSAKEFADWQLHDFSMRGMPGLHAAAKSGAAHMMVAGHGTDTLPAIDYIEEFYFADAEKELIGGSVPATEHSVMCMGGKDGGELATFKRLITETYPTGIVSIVSDTWDFWNVITNTALLLKDDILARKENALGQAKVVFRPDSGDPVKIICGLISARSDEGIDNLLKKNPDVIEDETGKFYEFAPAFPSYKGAEVPEHVVKGAVECLYDIFGGDVTDKGYKTLNHRVGLIYGDSITIDRAQTILKRLADKGFSAGNIVFGIGSYAYQYNTRDSLGMAMKATYGVVLGEGRELFKDPVTDSGVKKSAKGLLRVEKEGNTFVLYDQQENLVPDALEPVFCDGKLLRVHKYAEIVQRVRNGG